MFVRLLVVVLLASSSAFAKSVEPSPATRGRFTLLTYNVAGLPEAFSRRKPSESVPLVGPLLNAYDVAVVQEDFAYGAALAAGARHPHRATADGRLGLGLGDGLSLFSKIPFGGVTRVGWTVCNGTMSQGNDCLARKGYSRATLVLAPGVEVDVYNLHMDAGWSVLDRQARRAQVEQLVRALEEHSRDRAVIVAGDTNLRLPRDEDTLARLLDGPGLRDACAVLACGEERRVDRVLYRSGSATTLAPARWWSDPTFVDPAGRPLSDHRPVAVEMIWEPGSERAGR